MAGWRAAEPARVVRGEELFDLIDGGAMLYREYGFAAAAARSYEGPASATFQVEIYEMTDTAGAFGIYSVLQSTKGSPVDVGQEARLYDDYIAVWKGRHYISITGHRRRCRRTRCPGRGRPGHRRSHS